MTNSIKALNAATQEGSQDISLSAKDPKNASNFIKMFLERFSLSFLSFLPLLPLEACCDWDDFLKVESPSVATCSDLTPCQNARRVKRKKEKTTIENC